MIRKFYDVAAAEAKTSAKFTFPAEDLSFEKNLGMIPEPEKEEEIIEEKEEVKVEVKAEVKEEKVVEEVKQPEKVVEEKSKSVDWKELAKNPETKKEIIAALELDEEAYGLSKEIKSDPFSHKLLTYRKQNGNLTPFIEAATKDWDKINHQQLIIDDLKKQYVQLSPDKAEKLAKADYNARFIYREDPNIDEDENKELAELMELKLESEAEKIRIARKKEQADFLDSVKPVDTKAESDRLAKEKADAYQKEKDAFREMFEANPETKKLFADKKLVVGSNGSSYSYPVNPEAIKEQALDSNKFYGKFWKEDENGKDIFNVALWSKVVAYSENPEAFENFLIEKALNKGETKIVDELESKTEQQSSKTEVKKKSLGKAVEAGQAFSFQD